MTDIATMTASELADHIKNLELKHRKLLATLRALMRARLAEETEN